MPESKRRKKPQASPPRSGVQPSSRSRPGAPGAGAVASEAGWWTPERVQKAGWILIGLGVLTFLQHLVSHMGFFVVMSGTADDLLIGYPTAAVLVFAGVWLLGREDGKTRSRRPRP